MKKGFVWGVIVILFLLNNAFWFFRSFDNAVTIDYQMQEAQHKDEDIKLLKNLVVDLSSLSKKEEIIVEKIKEKYSAYLIKRENEILFIDGVGLKFENNILKEVVLINEVGLKSGS